MNRHHVFAASLMLSVVSLTCSELQNSKTATPPPSQGRYTAEMHNNLFSHDVSPAASYRLRNGVVGIVSDRLMEKRRTPKSGEELEDCRVHAKRLETCANSNPDGSMTGRACNAERANIQSCLMDPTPMANIKQEITENLNHIARSATKEIERTMEAERKQCAAEHSGMFGSFLDSQTQKNGYAACIDHSNYKALETTRERRYQFAGCTVTSSMPSLDPSRSAREMIHVIECPHGELPKQNQQEECQYSKRPDLGDNITIARCTPPFSRHDAYIPPIKNDTAAQITTYPQTVDTTKPINQSTSSTLSLPSTITPSGLGLSQNRQMQADLRSFSRGQEQVAHPTHHSFIDSYPDSTFGRLGLTKEQQNRQFISDYGEEVLHSACLSAIQPSLIPSTSSASNQSTPSDIQESYIQPLAHTSSFGKVTIEDAPEESSPTMTPAVFQTTSNHSQVGPIMPGLGISQEEQNHADIQAYAYNDLKNLFSSSSPANNAPQFVPQPADCTQQIKRAQICVEDCSSRNQTSKKNPTNNCAQECRTELRNVDSCQSSALSMEQRLTDAEKKASSDRVFVERESTRPLCQAQCNREFAQAVKNPGDPRVMRAKHDACLDRCTYDSAERLEADPKIAGEYFNNLGKQELVGIKRPVLQTTISDEPSSNYISASHQNGQARSRCQPSSARKATSGNTNIGQCRAKPIVRTQKLTEEAPKSKQIPDYAATVPQGFLSRADQNRADVQRYASGRTPAPQAQGGIKRSVETHRAPLGKKPIKKAPSAPAQRQAPQPANLRNNENTPKDQGTDEKFKSALEQNNKKLVDSLKDALRINNTSDRIRGAPLRMIRLVDKQGEI